MPSLLSNQQHFEGIFASEPMTLSEIDHVSFFAKHALYIFRLTVRIFAHGFAKEKNLGHKKAGIGI